MAPSYSRSCTFRLCKAQLLTATLAILAFQMPVISPAAIDCGTSTVHCFPSEYATFNEAYNVAQPGDTIYIEPGTHTTSQELQKDCLTVLGAGTGNTVLEFSWFRITTNDTCALIKNITFRNHSAVSIDIITGCRVDSCEFYGHTGTGTIKAVQNYVIRNSEIHNNDCGGSALGGGIYAGGEGETALIEHNEVYSNSAWMGGAIYVETNSVSKPIIRHNVIRSNSSTDRGGAIKYYNQVCSTYANTFFGNSGPRGSAIHIERNGVPPELIRNNIFSNNLDTFAIFNDFNDCYFGSCNDFWENPSGHVGNWYTNCGDPDGVNDCIVANPIFCNAPVNDFTLDSLSPCLTSAECGQIGALGVGCYDLEIISTPEVIGPSVGTENEPLEFTAIGAISSDGHTLEYQFDWDYHQGPNDPSPWQTDSQFTNQWPLLDTYYIRVHARCQLHPERVSYWSEPHMLTIIENYGSIVGTVLDATTSSPIVDANIRVLQGSTEFGSGSTDGVGYYSIPNIAPGIYGVEASASGYQTETQSGISVGAGDEVVVNFQLELGPACIPYIINGDPDYKLDVVFIPDHDYLDDTEWFLERVQDRIDQLFSIPPLDTRQDMFNFYYMEYEGDALSGCGGTPPDEFYTDLACAIADVTVILHDTEFGDCTAGSRFTAEGWGELSSWSSFMHESGHGMFRLVDLYCSQRTSYWENKPHANVWDSMDECMAETNNDPSDCVHFCTKYEKNWHKADNRPSGHVIMEDNQDGWGLDAVQRINWVLDQYGAGSLPRGRGDSIVVLVKLAFESNQLTETARIVGYGHPNNHLSTSEGLQVLVQDTGGHVLEAYDIADPRLQFPNDDSPYESYNDSAVFTVAFSFHGGLRFYEVAEDTSILTQGDLGQDIIDFCDSISYSDPLCQNSDLDNDGITDGQDNCPLDFNPLQEDTDSNGVGDICQGCCNGDGVRGDVDGQTDGAFEITVADLTYLVDYLFGGGQAPVCEDEGNVDGVLEGELPITVSDLTYLVAYLFSGGPEPPSCP